MKIYIRYYRNFVFGNYATEGFEIDPDSSVADLKKLIFARIRVDPKYQILRIKNHGQLEIMSEQLSINFYNVKEGNFIYLENIQEKDSESQVSWHYLMSLCSKSSKRLSRRCRVAISICRSSASSEI